MTAPPGLFNELFWTTAPVENPEVTPEDPLAFDYLAQQVGNWLFPGFTTRTNRAQYYAMTLYGLDIAERAIDVHKLSQNEQTLQRLFERFERTWCMAVARRFDGDIPDGERMRGVRGVTRNFRIANPERLPIDFELIRRQLELGALGAYLTSLRHYRLVEQGSLHPTLLGREVARSFWTSPTENKFAKLYDDYVLEVLRPGVQHIPAKKRLLTFGRLGENGRLGKIRDRPDQQSRLYTILFAHEDDLTAELSTVLERAHRAGKSNAKQILAAILKRQYGVSDNLRENCVLAYHFAEIASTLRAIFDGLYDFIHNRGLIANLDSLVVESMPYDKLKLVKDKAQGLLTCSLVARFGRLPLHGPAFLTFVKQIGEATPTQLIAGLIKFHETVQKERRYHGGWLGQHGNDLQIHVSSYRALRLSDEVWMHDFKIGAVLQLLEDLGRLE